MLARCLMEAMMIGVGKRKMEGTTTLKKTIALTYRKIILLLAALMLVFSMTGCGGDKSSNDSSGKAETETTVEADSDSDETEEQKAYVEGGLLSEEEAKDADYDSEEVEFDFSEE